MKSSFVIFLNILPITTFGANSVVFPNEKFRIENVRYVSRSVNKSDKDRQTMRRKRETSLLASNVTKLLDDVMENYEKEFRPGFEKGEPTKVWIDLDIRTMGPVSDLSYTYAFNCYFRQQWIDTRLRFNNSNVPQQNELCLSMAMLDKIWKPDSYFWNGANSYIHAMTSSNRLVRLRPDGTILYSSRITVQGRCSMVMDRYPLDQQACRLVIGSYSYSADEMQYAWRVVDGEEGIKLDYESVAELPQFSVIGYEILKPQNITRDRPYSALEARFYFRRHFSYYVMNFYVPCTLIVLLCWVAFFTNREATGERIGIGITNMLTLILISIDSKTDSPKVDLATALDVFIWICYLFNFLGMLEFTIVHYYTKFNTGDPEIQEVERAKLRAIIKRIPKSAALSSRHPHRNIRRRNAISTNSTNGRHKRTDGGRHSLYHKKKPRMEHHKISLTPQHSNNPPDEEIDHEGMHHENIGWRLYFWMIDNHLKTDPFGLAENSTSRIDRCAQICFPILFFAVVLLYFHLYLNSPYHFNFNPTIEEKYSF